MRSHIYNNPADDPEAEPFLKAIADAPGDQLHRQIFADWLEENGYENAAKGQRWAADHNKRPLSENDAVKPAFEGTMFPRFLTGWHDRYLARSDIPDEHKLPSIMFSQTVGTGPRGGGNYAWRLGGPAHQEPGTLLPEKMFLGRSHELNWHPETGEPVDPEAENR